MKKILAILLFLVFGNISQSRDLKPNQKLKIEINKNVELLGLAYFIGFESVDIETKTIKIDGKELLKKDWHNYGFKIYEKYKSFAGSANLGKAFSVADHLWLDYIITLLLQVESFPNAKLTDAVNESAYLNFSKKKDPHEAKQNASIFLDGMNEFYKEIDFDKYLTESKIYYDKSLEEVRRNLPNKDFITTMEKFYKAVFDSYSLIPSLTIPKGMGFGIRNTKDGKTNIYNVFGALDHQKIIDTNALSMGFANPQKLRELSVHEFGHSFVNHVVDKLPAEIFTKTEKLFEPLKEAMSDQGYNTWKISIYEHFVRAGEVVISEKLGDKEGAKKLQSNYEQSRQFKYLPEIIAELKNYDNGKHTTYYDAVLSAMNVLANE
jgi:hypothetical protein